jgi:uncharacterized membrane protein
MIKETKEEKVISKVFEISVFLKGIEGILEIISGALLVYTVETNRLVTIVLKLTEHELSQDPTDFLANKLIEIVNNINPGISFGLLYLLVHGIIKTFLSIMLLQRKLWAYPLAIYIFFTLAGLLLFEFFRGSSPLYILLAFFDLVVGILTIMDYKRQKKLICQR